MRPPSPFLWLRAWPAYITTFPSSIAAKLVDVAYGIKMLQIACVVEDDKVGVDFLEESITVHEDLVRWKIDSLEIAKTSLLNFGLKILRWTENKKMERKIWHVQCFFRDMKIAELEWNIANLQAVFEIRRYSFEVILVLY